ncbi:AMP-binding protein [Amycolatopsis acidiphila]|uniref:AMP-binding protein n=1 Tax=Amycolatopsis acidiphila TaxID=715473 RepID=A0A558A502_9PSEU|nr:AMP-binding protein [Amycolatopsis acidiphila]TVT19341.1 AMP-binding protein [Amycolatopsis acidiphila]UIJ61707.1 AMP-binding protein [Amycolatopsis acidiphila]
MPNLSYWPARDTDLVRDETVGDLLRETAERLPSAVALVEGVADPAARRHWTYAELLGEAEQAARALLGRFAPGERVAVWANNIPEWIVLEMAAALAGVTLATVNPALRPAELEHVLGQSRSSGVFLLKSYRTNPMADSLASVRQELPGLRETIFFEDWAQFRASGSPTEKFPVVEPGDAAQIQYTSGTTGVPKGAVLQHRGITNSARLTYVRTFDARPDDVFVNPMPLFHTAGCVLTTLSSIASGSRQVLLPHFDPALQLHVIESERGTTFGGVPTMLIAMLGHPDFPKTDLSSVRFALSGGATVPPDLVRRVEESLGVPMTLCFAQTEASPGITTTRLDDDPADRAETLGRPIPGVEVRIVDPSSGETVPFGQVGELYTRGFHVMTGYFDLPEQTAETIDGEGWLHTGDLVSMDSRGYCRIEGRVKEMIIRGGENIYPREIEHVLFAHPDVVDVAVVGIPDETWGEQVAAFVKLAPEATAGEDELFTYVRERLAPHKAPRIWQFVDRFPMTGSGKIQKFLLRDRFSA